MNRLLPAVVEPAAMAVWDNPLAPPTTQSVWPGTPLRDLAPQTSFPLMLRVNGQWLLREDWWRPAFPGDVIEWHILPQGGGGAGSRTILTIIAMVAITTLTGGLDLPVYAAAALNVGLNLAAVALINALVPIQQANPANNAQSQGSVYNVSLSANQARLNQPIPVIYGRMLVYPDFAAQPYTEYDGNNDQYFYALYCVGQGSYNFERVQIDDTAINSFQDVVWEILPPGQAAPTSTLFLGDPPKGNVVTAPEVAGQDLKSGQSVGGFAACGPTLQAASIGIDIVFPRGLGLADNSGNIGNLSASFQVSARPIDDFGTSTGNWYVLGVETVTRAKGEPQRLSFKYTLSSPSRVEVRIIRTDARNDSIRALHDMTWAGLRAYLDATPTLSSSATHLAVRVRASEQLSGLSQRRIGAIVRRKLRTWSQGGGWTAEVETRNPMWARLDKLTNAVYGDGLADSRIDLVTHAALAATYDTRQDRLDLLFDSKVTSIDADRTICMVGRAVPFQRGGVCTVARDQLQTLPVTAYTSRDILPGSMNIGYSLATEITADGVIVEYFNNRAWDWREILCKAPGVVTPVNAVRQRIMGITGAKHAEREGLYLAAQNMYRRKFPKFETEMQGMLPAYGSAVMFAPALPGWGQTGDVAFWNAGTLVMGLSEPAVFTAGASHYISIRRDDGSVTPAIAVTPGPTPYDVVLASAPMMADGITVMSLVLDDANRERPKFVFGASGQHRIMVRVLGIRKRGKSRDGAPTIEIETVAEDNRVHEVDLALLPGPGEIQDPVDGTTGGVGGSTGGGSYTIALVNLVDRNVIAGGQFGVTGFLTSYTLSNTGTSSERIWQTGSDVTNSISGQWASNAPLEPATVALYEVRATILETDNWLGSPADMTGSAATGAWLSLSTTRTWVVNGLGYSIMKVEIREASSGLVLDQATIALQNNAQMDSP